MQHRGAGGMHREIILHQPVDRTWRKIDGAAHERAVRRPAADAHDVLEMQIGRVCDATRVLQLRAGGTHLARGVMQRAAEAIGFFQHDNSQTARGGRDGSRHARGPGADDRQVEGLAHVFALAATLLASGVG